MLMGGAWLTRSILLINIVTFVMGTTYFLWRFPCTRSTMPTTAAAIA